jgi:hypothetical protein
MHFHCSILIPDDADMKNKNAPDPRGVRSKTLQKKAFSILVAALIAICLLEGILQSACRVTKGVWYPELRKREFPPLYEYDPNLRWRLRSNMNIRFRTGEFDTHVITDGRGIRMEDKENVATVSQPEPDILVIGDSFAFGWGVEAREAFAERLGCSGKLRALSLGVPGYGLEQEAIVLKAVLRREKPKLVIAQTWPIDWDILNSDRMVVAEHYLLTGETVRRTSPSVIHLRIELMENSTLYGILTRFSSLSHHVFHRNELLGGFGLDVFKDGDQSEMIAGARSRAFSAISGMKAAADAEGVPFAVVVVPSAFQVYPERQKSMERAWGISGRLDAERPDRELESFAESRGIHLLDLLPAFRERASAGRQSLYFRADPHWTAEGHELAAEAIRDFLNGRGLMER